MISPQVLMNALADRLRHIPELATIPVLVYDEIYPLQNDLALAVWQLKPPSLFVVWRGSGPASKQRIEVWRHNFSVVVRSQDRSVDLSYFGIWTAIMNGICDDTNCSFRLTAVHGSVYAMETPSVLRQTIFITPETRLDYHEVFINLIEKGDT